MRLGLLRHFPVAEPFPTGWRTASELQRWRERYEAAPIRSGPFDLGPRPWNACVSSDLPRARATAAVVFPGRSEPQPWLREVEFAEFPTGALRLPVRVWKWVYQLSWALGHSAQRASREVFRERVRRAADHLDALDTDTLVVSHAGLMHYLSRELRRRGWNGPRIGHARHAQVYLFERPRT